MGVQGLWQLISSTGRPVPLESLEGKILAVDVSVWLHQLSKGMRDAAGNPVTNAHLQGLFTRICKLLHYRIKPVFVFDGGVPTLKKQTLASRRNKREDAERSSSAATQKILTNWIRTQALKEAAGIAGLPDAPPTLKSSGKGTKEAMFELLPLPESSQSFLDQEVQRDDDVVEQQEIHQMIEDEYDDVDNIDVDSADFIALQPEIQHEIIMDMKERKKNFKKSSRISDLPEDAQDFSSFQMLKLLKHNKLNTRLDSVRKEINTRQVRNLGKFYGEDYDDAVIQSRRLASDDTSRFIYISGIKKSLQKKKKEEERRKLETQLSVISEDSGTVDELLEDSDNDEIPGKTGKQHRLTGDGIIKDAGPNANGKDREFRIDNKDSKDEDEDFVKPVYRPVIEIDSDSDSESDEDTDRMIVDNETDAVQDNDHAYLEDDSEFHVSTDLQTNRDLQIAILKSIKEQKGVANESGVSENLKKAQEMIDLTDDHNVPSSGPASQVGKEFSVNVSNIRRSKRTKENSSNLIKDSSIFKRSVSNKSDMEEKEKATEQDVSEPVVTVGKKVRGKDKPKDIERETAFNDHGKMVCNVEKSVSEEKRAVNECIGRHKQNSLRKRKGMHKEEEDEKDDSGGVNEKGDDIVKRRRIGSEELEDSQSGNTDSGVKVLERFKKAGNSRGNSETLPDEQDSSGSSDEEAFIEVTVDPKAAKPDDLFPASIFQIGSEGNETKKDIQKTKFTEAKVRLSAEEDMASDHSDNDLVISDTEHEPVDTVKETDVRFDIEHKLSNLDNDLKNAETEPEDSESEAADTDGSEKPEEVDNMIAQDEDATPEIERDTFAHQEELSNSSGFPDVLEGTEVVDSAKVPDVVEDAASPECPKVPDLVKAYESLTEQSIKGMRENLVSESRALQQERGRQERLAMSITEQMNTEAQELLQLFGIPWVVSPTEAEAQCAQLERAGLVQGTITEDSDIWLFGGTCVFKNFFNQQKHVECFKESTLLSQLGLTRDVMINLALLCGSDYTEGIQGVGYVTAMEILAEFPGEGIDKLVIFRTWWEEAQKMIRTPKNESKLKAKLRQLDISEGFPSQEVVEAYLNPTVDHSTEPFSWTLPDLGLLRKFASERLGWAVSKTDEILLPVLKRLNEKVTQRRISAFFQPEIYMQPSKMKSKRLQKAVNQFLNPEQASEDSATPGQESEASEVMEAETGASPAKKVKRSGGQGRGRGRGRKKAETEDGVNGDDTVVSGGSGKRRRGRPRKNAAKLDPAEDVEKLSVYFDDSESSKDLEVSKSSVSITEKVAGSSKSGTSDSDSDSDSSGSSEWDSDTSPSDEMKVVEQGLNIGEILNLKMGAGIEDSLVDKFTSEKPQKVYESGLNVMEIMTLKEASDDLHSGTPEKIDLSDSIPEGKTVSIESEVSNEQDNDESSDVQYALEGGFIREDSDSDELETETNKSIAKTETNGKDDKNMKKEEILKEKKNSQIDADPEVTSDEIKTLVTETSNSLTLSIDASIESKKQKTTPVSKRTRSMNVSRKVVSKSEDTMIDLKEIKKEPELDNTSCGLENEGISKAQAEGRSQQIKKEKTAVLDNVTVKSEVTPLRGIEPIKTIVTGVPWAQRGRGKRKGGKGRSRELGRQIIPTVEIKREKKDKKQCMIGCVNLSESDSDSSS